jgi:lipoyl(octanoyl) transferase
MRLRWLGRRAYAGIEDEMRAFTEGRDTGTEDELWLVEHDPVYTLGVAGRRQHLLAPGDVPVVQTNRGGQVTYHGPGQIVAYPLVDLRRLGIYAREYVFRLEAAVLQTLQFFGVTGHRVRSAPGIYVRLDDPGDHAALPPVAPGADPFSGLGKIAALGVKITRHCSYHGVALNVAMDLEPFLRIDPCGHAGLRTVDLRSLGLAPEWSEVADLLAARLRAQLAP